MTHYLALSDNTHCDCSRWEFLCIFTHGLSLLNAQVTWQQLAEDSRSGNPGQPGNIASAAFVVTSQRLLIVGPDLALLAATPQRSSGAFITSALWVGPALLYCDSANAVGSFPEMQK